MIRSIALVAALTTAFFSTFLSADARACKVTYCDPYGYISWTHDPSFYVHVNMGTGDNTCYLWTTSNFLNDFLCAAVAWNSVNSSWFDFLTATNSWAEWDNGDGVNNVHYLPGTEFDPGVMGKTWLEYGCSWWDWDIWEADIGFNAEYEWDHGPVAPGSDTAARAVAMHELGHALGLSILSHQNGLPATMNSGYPDGGWFRGDESGRGLFKPLADDRTCDEYLYEAEGTDRDLGIIPYRWSSGAGTSILVSPPSPASVCPGDTTNIKFTVMSMSNQSFSNVRMGYYLSTNDWISTYDTLVGTQDWDFPAYSQGLAETAMTIPSWVAPGTYYVGPYIDDNNTVTGEAWETVNNAVTMPGTLTVKPPAQCP